MLTMLLAVAAQATFLDDLVDRATKTTRVVTMCRVGPECENMRARAGQWIQANRRMRSFPSSCQVARHPALAAVIETLACLVFRR